MNVASDPMLFATVEGVHALAERVAAADGRPVDDVTDPIVLVCDPRVPSVWLAFRARTLGISPDKAAWLHDVATRTAEAR